MITVNFVGAGGATVADAAAGDRLLDVAQANGQPLEGTCEGQMACATCHVIVDPADFPRLPQASEEEEDMIDLVPDAERTSRLACQIWLPQNCDSLTIRIPAGTHGTRHLS